MAPKAKVQRQNTLQISEWSEVELDKRVQTVIAGKTYLGTVRFSGKTQFAEGHWIGIELDEAVGKNDGSVQGSRYFSCPAQHGLFCRPNITRPTAETSESANQTGGLVDIKKNIKEMLTLAEDLRAKQEALTSSAKLQSDVLAHLEHLERLAHLKIAEASHAWEETSSGLSQEAEHLQVGQRVHTRMLKDSARTLHLGTVRFNGTTHFAPGPWIGIELDEPVGLEDGSVQEHRYFTCTAKHGVFHHPAAVFPAPAELAEIRECIKELRTKADALHKEQEATTPSSNGLMEKLELLQEQLQLFEPEALELELERGRAEAHQLRRQLAEAKTTVTEAQTKATEVQMNEAQLAKDSQSQHASADLDAKLAALEKQHDDFQRSAAERAQKLEMQRQELQKDLELEREQRDRARAEAHELRTQLAEARAELETGTPGTRGQLAMLQKEREEMEREAFAKDQEIQRQSAKLEELSQALKRESEKLALKEQQIKDSEMRLLQELEQERGRGRAAHKLPLAEDATAPDTPKASKASKARAEKVQEQLQPEAERCGKRLPQHPGEVATVAQVHGLMAQVERLNATVEHLAAKREPQLVDPEAGPSTRRCQARAARAARSPFCFDESSILPDATDAPSPSGRLSDPFVPNVPSDPRAASETLLPDLEATDATIEPPRVHAEPGRRRLSDPFVPNAPSDPRAASETLPPDLEATDATIEPPRVHAEPGRRRLSGRCVFQVLTSAGPMKTTGVRFSRPP
ncbi:unnamed protein product [Durusdinium trenchii]|uniref:CAP-Gly domain-containing protein n=1 Tax=Durusdinium trenchii TaxID=1381693 RepID=A0ABP0ILY8_9DINO